MAKRRRRSKSERERYWRKIISDWLRSGLTQAAFCRKHSVSLWSLRSWRSELARRDRQGLKASGRGKRAPQGFIPVSVVASPVAASRSVEVVLSNGRILRVDVDGNAEALARLAAALEQQPC